MKSLGHAGFRKLALELDLPEGAVNGTTLKERSASLAQYLLGKSVEPIVSSAADAIVERASAQINRYGTALSNVSEDECEAFKASLAVDSPPAESQSVPHAQPELQNESAFLRVPFGRSGEVAKPAEDARNQTDNSRRVFVVHGRDSTMRDVVAAVLYKAKCKPIILSEQVDAGQTIIEKIEKHGDVEFAVVLLSPDDFGGLAGEAAQPRTRQNVLLELGYFFGLLGRKKLAILMKGQVEFPSDFAGVVWRAFDDQDTWKIWLVKEINAAGISIDWSDFHA